MTNREVRFTFAVVAVFLALSPVADAHRLDEYLQATRISVAPDRIGLEIDLTAGASIAPQIFASIDTDHDGQLSPEEAVAYCQFVLKSITLTVDGRVEHVILVDHSFPEFRDMASGVGTIRVRGVAVVEQQTSGSHQLYYRNIHEPEVGAYLVNALVPDDKLIEIGRQRRDYEQHELTLEYRVVPDLKWAWIGLLIGGLALLICKRNPTHGISWSGPASFQPRQ